MRRSGAAAEPGAGVAPRALLPFLPPFFFPSRPLSFPLPLERVERKRGDMPSNTVRNTLRQFGASPPADSPLPVFPCCFPPFSRMEVVKGSSRSQSGRAAPLPFLRPSLLCPTLSFSVPASRLKRREVSRTNPECHASPDPQQPVSHSFFSPFLFPSPAAGSRSPE